MKDPIRRVNREIWLKMKALKSAMSWMQYNKYPHLKSAEEFQSESWAVFGRDKIGETMLVHVTAPIHTCLCRDVPASEVKNAKLMFKNMLMFMGDKRYSGDVDALASELVTIAMNSSDDSLRSEVYVQLMKQLTKNPNPESNRKGWRLMGLLLKYIMPSETLEDYLICFLMQRKSAGTYQAYVSTFHELKYRNSGETYVPPQRPPSQMEVKRLMDSVQNRDFRSRYSMKEIVQQHDVAELRSSKMTTTTTTTTLKRNYVTEEEEMSRLKISKEEDNYYDEDEEEEEEETPPPMKPSRQDDVDEPIMYAAYDFEAMDDTVIGLQVDDKVKLLAEPEDDGWVYVENLTTGESGYAPTDYLEKR